MFKQKLEIVVNAKEDREHRFTCDPNAPLGEIYDCLGAMQNYVLNRIVEHHNKGKKQENPKQEEIKDGEQERTEPCENGVEEQDCEISDS